MEVEGCGCFTHLQSIWSDLVTILSELGRPLESRRTPPTYTGRGSPPMLLEDLMNRIFSQLQRIGYITHNAWSGNGNDGTKPVV
ncbi:MAG: hypothetical protein RTV72_12195 [Candidatus Thorarchaeota archaeon]